MQGGQTAQCRERPPSPTKKGDLVRAQCSLLSQPGVTDDWVRPAAQVVTSDTGSPSSTASAKAGRVGVLSVNLAFVA